MTRAPVQIKDAILSQQQFNSVTGLSDVTTNNYVARNVLRPAEIGGRLLKGIRLWTIEQAYVGCIIHDLVQHHKIPASAAAKIAELATQGGWIEHWARAIEANRPFLAAYMAVAWRNNCYESQITNADKDGLPDFSTKEMKRFLKHSFIVLPLATLFINVYKKCLMVLAVRVQNRPNRVRKSSEKRA